MEDALAAGSGRPLPQRTRRSVPAVAPTRGEKEQPYGESDSG